MRLTVLFLLVLVAPAQAATVMVDRDVYEDIREDIRTTTLVYRAAPGERNRLTVSARGRTVVLVDRGARIRAGRSCRSLSRHRARCRLDRGLDPYFGADLRDRGDHFRERSFASFTYVVRGGDGADRLLGGPGNDQLSGEAGDDVVRGRGAYDVLGDGPGRDVVEGGASADRLLSTDRGTLADDRFDGGVGRDELTYGSRRRPVTGRLGRYAGERGEHDRVIAVEDLAGGQADDVLRGTAGPDVLEGDDGADRLYGYGGDDQLSTGVSGGDRVHAGPGDDQIEVAFRSRVGCGPGRDAVHLNEAVALLRECERVDDAYQRGAFPAQPLRVTPRVVVMALPCAERDAPSVRRVRLLVEGLVRAEGRRPVGEGSCRVRLRLTRPVRRPLIAQVQYRGDPRWRFVLRP